MVTGNLAKVKVEDSNPFALSNFNYTIILQKAFQYTFNKFLF